MWLLGLCARATRRIAARRDGDAPSVWASTEYAEKELGWK
jgi:UDP-glucose 4-epimerase